MSSASESSMTSAHGSPSIDPLRTLAREMQREEERAAAAAASHMYTTAAPSPPRGFTIDRSAFHQQQDYRSEFSLPPTSAAAHSSSFQNPELRALAESMRSLNQPLSSMAPPSAPVTSLTHSHHAASSEWCPICEAEENQMNQQQRRIHEQHMQSKAIIRQFQEQQQQQAERHAFERQQLLFAKQQQQVAAVAHQQQPAPAAYTSTFAQPNGLTVPFSNTVTQSTGSADESLLYSSQPSRAVLSALRSLQDKLSELRVEKSALENKMVKLEQEYTAREYEVIKKSDRALADAAAKAADIEQGFLTQLKDSRAAEEKSNSYALKLEGEIRMHRDNAQVREADNRSLRDEIHKLKLKLNDTELLHAKAQNETSASVREHEVARASLSEKDVEITRLKLEVNKYSENMHLSQTNNEQLKLQLFANDEARQVLEGNLKTLEENNQRLAMDIKIVSKDLLREKAVSQKLLQFKYMTREYCTSLLNLNYELCIDMGMSLKKRGELLKHTQDLLQGLKKQAWSMEEEFDQAMNSNDQANLNEDGELVGSNILGSSINGGSNVIPMDSPSRKATINGVSTSIEEQRYLLAGASSPEAIRVIHPERYGHESEDSDDEGVRSSQRRNAASANEDQRVKVYVPTSPTVASTNKTRRRSASTSRASSLARGPVSVPTKGSKHFHSLKGGEISLPYTIGRSAKQSFSVPVNVQEILSKQPSYYSVVAEKTLAQQRRKSSGSAGSHLPGPVEEERIYVQPAAPHQSLDIAPPSPVSLAAHSVGLSTVIHHLESEMENLNRDYIYNLDNARRDDDDEKQALQNKLQTILKQIEKKTKQIEALKQHQEAVLGNHGVRLYSASTTASRNSRAAPVAKASTVLDRKRLPSSSSSHRPASASTGGRKSLVPSTKKSSSSVVVSASQTDLTDKHAHHHHGTEALTPRKAAATYSITDEHPHRFGFLSPNSQRLLEKKIKSMRLLGQFKEMFEGEGGFADGEAAKRFGSD